MALNHFGPIDTAEIIENVRAWAHTANAVALPDGGLFLVWSAGQFEEAEDMVVAGARMDKDGKWGKAHVVVDRFELEGETWIPWCPTVLQAADGSLHVFCMGNPRSGYIFAPYPVSTVRSAWMLGDDQANRMFHACLKPDLTCGRIEMLLPDENGVNVQGRPLHLQSGGWAVPFDSMTTLHSHFLILDEQVRFREKRGDLVCPPGSCEPAVVQLPNGDVICYVRFDPKGSDWYSRLVKDAQTPHGHIWKTVSHDECRTFSEPVPTNLRNPNAGIDIALARSGRFLIAFNDSYSLRLPLSVGISDDLGRTFRVRDVETALAEPYYGWPFANYMRNCHAYPKLAQTRNGIWHLFYSHRMECIKHVWFDEQALEQGRKVVGLDD